MIAHVTQFKLLGMPDIELRRFASERGYCIVSNDSDFNQRAFENGATPKVTWLRLGDATTEDIAASLCKQAPTIEQFLKQDSDAVLEIP